MANQIVVSSGAKVRDLNDVIIGTSGVLSSLAFNVSNGVPKLDVNGKILVSQLPNSVMEYLGTWNAATNTPTLVNGTGNAGDVYLCNVAGTVDFGAGPISFVVSDQVIYSGTIWQKASGSNGTVTSVGLTSTGNDAITITGSPITTSGNINLGFAGTNLQYINGAGDLTTFPTLISSIGLSMPSAFNVSNSPLTANGTIGVTGAGVASQYIRGDGTLADFPTSGGGGGSVSYYLNGGTSQGVIGGVTYYEMSKIAVIGTGVDFPKTGDGFIVAFLTDAGDPAQLNIPAGNWNYEIYASMSANGGTPQLYAELYKYDGTTFTLIGTSTNEILYDGTTLNLYTFAMAVPATTLAITDRLAVKLYATNSGGKTTTVHTQDGHLCQIITTFSTGITALNGLTAQVQFFATGTSGTDFAINSSTATHTFNLPTASATNRGALSSADWTTFNNKQATISLTTTGSSGAATLVGTTLNIPNYTTDLSGYVTLGTTQTITGQKTFSLDILVNNLTIGKGSGTGTLNTAIGQYALFVNTTGYGNTSVGHNALGYNTTGFFNAAIGANALLSNTIGTYNNALGTASLYNNTTGSNNTAVGQQAGTGNTTGSNNTYIGSASGSNITTGSNNTIIGAYAGTFTMANNIVLADGAGNVRYRFDGTNNIFANNVNFSSTIGNGTYTYTLPSASGTLALTSDIPSLTGYVPYTGATTNVTLGAFNLTADNVTLSSNLASLTRDAVNSIGILRLQKGANGYIQPSTLSVDRYYTLPDATGTIALTADLANYLPLAGGTLTGALNGINATFSSSVIVGSASLLNFGPITNFVGMSGNNSTGILSLYANNILALNFTSTAAASFSSTVTAKVISSDQTDGGAFFIKISGASTGSITSTFQIQGSGSKLDLNAYVYGANPFGIWTNGTQKVIVTSAGNVGIGTTSPARLLTVYNASADPFISLYGGATNEGGILFGNTSGGDALGQIRYLNGSNFMYFVTNGSERMRITSTGNVGIGTSSPGAILHTLKSGTAIAGIGDEVFIGQRSSSTNNAAVVIVSNNESVLRFTNTASVELGAIAYETTNNNMLFKTNSSERMRITSGGNVFIGYSGGITDTRLLVISQGTTSSTYSIVIKNSSLTNLFYIRDDGAFFTGSAAASPYNNTTGTAANLIVLSDGSLARSTSSLKYKNNVENYTKGLAEVMKLRPVSYEGKNDIDNGKQFAGLIAEEVHELGLTEFVQYAEDGSPDALAYSNMVALLVKAIQELKAEIDQLKNK